MPRHENLEPSTLELGAQRPDLANVRAHYGLRDKTTGTIISGVHEEEGSAIDAAIDSLSQLPVKVEVVYLETGQRYQSQELGWRTHGVNDSTHQPAPILV